MSEKTTSSKVDEIYDAVIGQGLHKGDGILDRLARLETWKNNQSKTLGAVGAGALIFGYLVGIILKFT